MKFSNTENDVAIFMAMMSQASRINLNELINIRMHLKYVSRDRITATEVPVHTEGPQVTTTSATVMNFITFSFASLDREL